VTSLFFVPGKNVCIRNKTLDVTDFNMEAIFSILAPQEVRPQAARRAATSRNCLQLVSWQRALRHCGRKASPCPALLRSARAKCAKSWKPGICTTRSASASHPSGRNLAESFHWDSVAACGAALWTKSVPMSGIFEKCIPHKILAQVFFFLYRGTEAAHPSETLRDRLN